MRSMQVSMQRQTLSYSTTFKETFLLFSIHFANNLHSSDFLPPRLIISSSLKLMSNLKILGLVKVCGEWKSNAFIRSPRKSLTPKHNENIPKKIVQSRQRRKAEQETLFWINDCKSFINKLCCMDYFERQLNNFRSF